MREIKIRVWDTNDYIFRYDCSIDSDGKANASWGKTKSHWVIQFFTGAKDQNGKEIYEGDILTFKYKEYDNNKWIESRGSVYFDNDLFGYLVDMDCGFRFGEIKDIKVIGNIFENRELLK